MNFKRHKDFNNSLMLETARTKVAWLDCSRFAHFSKYLLSQSAAIGLKMSFIGLTETKTVDIS